MYISHNVNYLLFIFLEIPSHRNSPPCIYLNHSLRNIKHQLEVVAEEEVEEDLEERVEEAEVRVGLECVEAEGESLLLDLSYDREGVRGGGGYT